MNTHYNVLVVLGTSRSIAQVISRATRGIELHSDWKIRKEPQGPNIKFGSRKASSDWLVDAGLSEQQSE